MVLIQVRVRQSLTFSTLEMHDLVLDQALKCLPHLVTLILSVYVESHLPCHTY